MGFHGITFLVFVVGALMSFFKFIDQRWKEAIWWFFGAVAFHMVPTVIDSWLHVSTSGSADRKWADVVGNWYGGGNAATIINHMASVGTDYGEAIWAALASTFIPQLFLLAWGWRAYMKHHEGDKKALITFFLVGSLIIPNIIGGPGAAAPRVVMDQGSQLMSTIVKDFSTKEKEQMGYTLRDIEIARRNARLPLELRPAIAVYNDMARFTSNLDEKRPTILTSDGYQEYKGHPITTKGVSILATRGSKEGPDGYMTMPDLASYLKTTDLTKPTEIWTDEINDKTIWSRLSDGQGLLRDKSDLGYQLTAYPMAGSADVSVLREAIKGVYDYYNERRKGKTKEELTALIKASLETGDASAPPIDYAALEERVGQAIAANAKVVEPPDVVELSRSLGLHEQLQLAMRAYYQHIAGKFSEWERAQYSVPNYLYDPDFYGVLLFADGFSIPLNQKDPRYADASKLTEKGNWDNLMSSDGIQRDLARGYSTTGTAGSLDGEGFFDIFFEAPAWLGFKIITCLIALGLPLVKHVVPHVAGFAFLFIMASYPVFALVSLFPGRWTALLDWAKAVLWVMSWAVCYQIGLGWTESMPVALTVDQGSIAEGLTQNIFVLMGMFMMVAAPALTGFVLSATANALQNIGSTIMTIGFKAAGGAFVMGAVVMAAVGSAIATVLAPVVAPAAAAAAKVMGVAGSGAGAGAGAAGAAGGAAAKGGSSLASAAMSQGGMFSRFGGAAMQTLQSAASNAKAAGNATAGVASMGMQRWDAFMGTGAGVGANAVGPIAPDERWKKRGGGQGSAQSAGPGGGAPPPNAVTISRGAGGGDSLLPSTSGSGATRQSPAVGTAAAADAHDRSMAGGDAPTKGQLAKAELLHSQAANFAGDPGRAAASASMAAEAASLTGSKSTGTRIARAEQAVGAAVSATSEPAGVTAAHLAGARTQMAKARHLSEAGDSVGASVAQQAASGHLQRASVACIQAMSVAGASGDEASRIQHVSTLAGIGSAAQSLQSQSSGPAASSCGTVVAQVSAALHAAGQSGGASGEAAKGYSALMAGNSQAAEPHFRSASSQAGGDAKQAMLSAAVASSGSVSVSGVVQMVSAQMAPGKGLAANAYDRPESPAKA